MPGREPLQGPSALSESILWPLTREYYQRTGVRGWVEGVVPDMITTNAYVAAAYARMVIAFLRDWRETTTENPDGPVHVIELGAGPGRFAHGFITKLAPRLAQWPSLQGISVRHVMSDLPGGNVDRWRRHPTLRRHVGAGRLDFATLDASRPSGIKLVESGDVLELDGGTGPLVVIANYILDSLPLDVFLVDDGRLREHLVTVYAESGVSGRPAELDDVAIDWSTRPIGDNRRYLDDEMEAVLRAVTAGPASRSVLFPTAAIHLLQQLQRLSSGPLLVLSADKGPSRPSTQVFDEGPYMAIHGSISFSVDFSVLAAYVRRRGGLALLPMHETASLTAATFVLNADPEDWPSVAASYRDELDVGGPDDFFSLEGMLSSVTELPTFAQLLARLRIAEWDNWAFRRVFPGLMAHLYGAGEYERSVVLDAVRRVEELYLPIGETADVPFALGMLSWRAGDPVAGLRRLRWSAQLHGPDAERHFGMALCHVSAGDLGAAVDALTAALEQDPGWPLPAKLGRWLVDGTAAEEGALGDTTSNWAGPLPVYDKWPGTRAIGDPRE